MKERLAAILCIIFLLAIGLLSAYSEYGAPVEFGNATDTTCWIGGDYGELRCIGPLNVSSIITDEIDISDDLTFGGTFGNDYFNITDNDVRGDLMFYGSLYFDDFFDGDCRPAGEVVQYIDEWGTFYCFDPSIYNDSVSMNLSYVPYVGAHSNVDLGDNNFTVGTICLNSTCADDWSDISTPTGGDDTEVQFNDAGSFGGDNDFTYNKITNVLSTAGGYRATWTADNVPLYSEASKTTSGIGFLNPAYSTHIHFIIDGTTRFRMDNTAFDGTGNGAAWIRANAGGVAVPEYSWNNDPNTGMFKVTSDTLGFSAGGLEFLRLVEGGTDVTVFNEGSADIDFRIESNTETHMFYIDSGEKLINISGGYGSTGVTIYDDGNISTDGTITGSISAANVDRDIPSNCSPNYAVTGWDGDLSTTYCTQFEEPGDYLENGTDANFGKLSSGKLNVTVSSGGAATIGNDECSATGGFAVAMGEDTNASGYVSTARGYDTTASGSYSTSMGYKTTASGSRSVATGYGTIASGWYTTAIGREIEAGANYVVAIGLADMNGVNCNQANSMCIMGGNVCIGCADPNATLHIGGDIIADNVFLHSHIFTHTNVTQTVASAGVWVNVTFDVHAPPIKERITHNWEDGTNDTFTIVDTGEYRLDANLVLKDGSATPTTNGGYRFVQNGVEIAGSGRPVDVDRQDFDKVSDTFVVIDLTAGDEIKLQFTADSTIFGLEPDCLYLDHCTTAVISIKRTG